ncbi:Na(+)/H(+) antiporter subunit C [Spelaeicoccus albus]|uniref:Multicomponent Na+:H+ antiporter subunit C n=1 Tax=Spelaeicoccus albus TaxID=1280376 RepID=A0A7Z0CZJ9_9MICO|nr:Na(+)/H(+) antiporter subunit C [Spelaeicoccus albus]NYI66339.1 multicomponent Na+:H+ antiporter subunit C [Spelaeicoccus albus]
MNASLALLVLVAILVACGTYLLLDRSLTRVLLGTLLIGNGVNVLVLMMGGYPGSAPIVQGGHLSTDGMSDPLPQALILTAIVITFGISAFILAMIYRSWRLAREDVVADDEGDVRIAEEALAEGTSGGEASTGDEDYTDTEFGAATAAGRGDGA